MSGVVDVRFIVWAPSCGLHFGVNHSLPQHFEATVLLNQLFNF